MQLEDFARITIEDGIATICIDVKGQNQNTVSPVVINLFEDVFNELEQNNEIKAAIFISGKEDFMAGADIKAFEIDEPGQFRPIQEKGHRSLDRLEKSKKPIVSAVHGTAYGLGTELSLACHARICSDSPRTKFALPEVKIGILPGGGGTQRLPRLVGLQNALDMMLTGKNIYAFQAKKMGLVDAVVDRHKLLHAAKIIARQLIEGKFKRKKKESMMNRFLNNTSVGRSIVFKKAREQANKQARGNYPAIPAILDCVETGLTNGLKAGYERELVLFEELLLGKESAALRSIFYNMTANKKNPWKESARPIKTLGMIGAGFMGAGITEVSIKNDVHVLLKDLNEESIASAKKDIWKGLKKKIKYKTLTRTAAEKTIGRLHPKTSYNGFKSADIVIEAVVEKMEVKKIIIDEIKAHCKSDVIIASNTSSLSLGEMADYAGCADRVIGMHYFSPVPKMPLLEIVVTPETADWVIGSCYDLGLKQGKTCIVVKDGPGFYVNRILAPYINECMLMIDEGADFGAIDKALSNKGFPVGPITLVDEVGLDIVAHVVKSSEKLVAGRPGVEISYGTVKMCEAGRLGKKNKSGFFSYDQKGKKTGIDKEAYGFFKGDGSKSMDEKDVQDRAIMLMLNEAVLCLQEEIIDSPTTGDVGAVFGIGFLPFTGGPFRYIDQLGTAEVVKRMEELKAMHGARFESVDLLREMAQNGKLFHD